MGLTDFRPLAGLLSFDLKGGMQIAFELLLPSPFGAYVFQTIFMLTEIEFMDKKFPSPYGGVLYNLIVKLTSITNCSEYSFIHLFI